VDGYCEKTRPVYELVDCYWNRHTCLPVRDVTTVSVGTLAERYEETMFRLKGITSAGYTVNVMWECDLRRRYAYAPNCKLISW
jgi:G:T-mismatch repair DNA endonuclease (very short patch repair protein)